MPESIAVVGVGADGSAPSGPAAAALCAADLVVGGRRHLALAPAGAATEALGGDLASSFDRVAAADGRVCVLASGDPGFFGIVRSLAERFGSDRLTVWPAVSSVAVAFARLGLPWDDATVVSAHGRPLADAVAALSGARKAAVLVSPDCPPQAVGRALLDVDARFDRVTVCARLGEEAESVVVTDLAGLAAGEWDPVSVVVLVAGDGVRPSPAVRWASADDEGLDHREGMITRAEVRAVALSKLDPPTEGVLWDVGAGSGSVGIDAATGRPGLRVFSVERRDDDVRRIRANAGRRGATVSVVAGEAPAALADLPDPDRVFVGGGGLGVLDACLTRLRPGGRVVATYAALDRAAAAADRLGELVQVGVARGRRLPDGGLRLAADNPVFVAWGPSR